MTLVQKINKALIAGTLALSMYACTCPYTTQPLPTETVYAKDSIKKIPDSVFYFRMEADSIEKRLKAINYIDSLKQDSIDKRMRDSRDYWLPVELSVIAAAAAGMVM